MKVEREKLEKDIFRAKLDLGGLKYRIKEMGSNIKRAGNDKTIYNDANT